MPPPRFCTKIPKKHRFEGGHLAIIATVLKAAIWIGTENPGVRDPPDFKFKDLEKSSYREIFTEARYMF